MSGNVKGGNDTLDGSSGNSFLFGDAQFYSPSSPGSITGGKDLLIGGPNDQLWGGPNDDTFKFNLGAGNNVIHDFDQGNLAVGSTAPEHDVIDVKAYGFANWNALHAAISDDSSGNAVIHLTPDNLNTISLDGVHTANLHQTDFIIT
jgi:hypothetical protein